VLERLDQLAANPFDPRIAEPLTNKGALRKSRVGGWRIIFRVEREILEVPVITIARRGQVYQRM
jgi:mRNA interferase RelE/StbE